MTLEYAILLGLIFVVSILIVFIFNEIIGFFFLLGIRILSEGLVTYSFGISGINAGSIFGIAIIIYSLFIIFFKKDATINISILKPFYLFILLSLFSFYNSNNILLFFSHLFKYIAQVSIFLISYNLVRNLKHGEKALNYFLFISIPIILLGFYQLITKTGTHSSVHGVIFHKIMSTFAHPNGYSFYLGLIIFTLMILIQRRTTYKIYYYILLISAIISTLFTYSRSVWLSVAICSLIALVSKKSLRFPLIIISLFIFLVFSSIIVERFGDITHHRSDGAVSSSLDFRINMSKSLFTKAFPQHPFIGFGLGSSQDVAKKFTKMDTVPHNDYMRVLIESGIIGFSGFLIFILSNIVFLFRNIRYFGKNIYFTGLFIIIVYFTGIIIGTNQLGNISTCGMWFCLFGILFKLFHLSLSDNSYKEAI